MKRLFIVLFIVLVAIGLFLFVYDYRSGQEQSFSDYFLNEEDLAQFQDGDIILRHGYGMVSDLITETMNDGRNVSHCAIISRDSTGISVIHSVSQSLSKYDGVQKQGIRRFIKDSKPNSIILLRYRGGKDNSLISQFAHVYLNKKVPFDHSFKISDTSEFFCTELLWKVFLNAYNVDIFSLAEGQKYDPLRFDAFYDTSRFELVFDHNRIRL